MSGRISLVTSVALMALAASATNVVASNVVTVNDDDHGPPPFVRAQMAFMLFDSDRDNSLAIEEVPEAVWERLSPHDHNDDGLVTRQELKTSAAERVFGSFDEDGDGALTEQEVPARVWGRMSRADSDEDGTVTVEEFSASQLGPRNGDE